MKANTTINPMLTMLFRGFGSSIQFVPCTEWVWPHHIFLQLAHFFIFLGLFFGSSGIYTLIFLRTMLLIANLITLLWTWLVSCSGDLLVWNSVFAVLNAMHIFVLLCRIHPFIRFPHEVEMAYQNLFQPLGVSRYNFKRLYSYIRGVQSLKPKDIYALENQTSIDRLSLLLSGRISVSRNGVTCHIIDCYQFLESPEWFGMSTSDTYQVSFVALEESQVLVWNRDKLKLSISSDRYLQTILDHILGKDIVKKLMLSMDIETQNAVTNEKTKLMHNNITLDQQFLSLGTIKNASQCFWNLSSAPTTSSIQERLNASPHETTL